MSRHNSSDVEQLLSLLFSGIMWIYRAALFVTRAFRQYRAELQNQRNPQGSDE